MNTTMNHKGNFLGASRGQNWVQDSLNGWVRSISKVSFVGGSTVGELFRIRGLL